MVYTVVQAYGIEEFTKLVNKMLASGWKLQGGLALEGNGGDSIFFQSMIKETK